MQTNELATKLAIKLANAEVQNASLEIQIDKLKAQLAQTQKPTTKKK